MPCTNVHYFMYKWAKSGRWPLLREKGLPSHTARTCGSRHTAVRLLSKLASWASTTSCTYQTPIPTVAFRSAYGLIVLLQRAGFHHFWAGSWLRLPSVPVIAPPWSPSSDRQRLFSVLFKYTTYTLLPFGWYGGQHCYLLTMTSTDFWEFAFLLHSGSPLYVVSQISMGTHTFFRPYTTRATVHEPSNLSCN